MKKLFFFSLMCLVTLAMQAQNFVDLGLPSGTKWANANESGHYTYGEALNRFGSRVPSKTQWEELISECEWTWSENIPGWKVTGSNGNSISLLLAGYRDCDGDVNYVASGGYYWSSTPVVSGKALLLYICSSGGLIIDDRCNGLSVRLVQEVTDGKQIQEVTDDKQERQRRKSEMLPQGYVDLGLPSGTLWKDRNEEGGDNGYYTYDEAVSKFGDSLPTEGQFEELIKQCKWSWTGSGSKVTGLNGNSIFLPATGWRDCNGWRNYVGTSGYYWSSTPGWHLNNSYYGVNMYHGLGCDEGMSVRLVQEVTDVKQERQRRKAEMLPQGYVDLGLPSGTLWKDINEEGGNNGIYTYDEAVSKFGDRLPTKKQFEELRKSCQWSWTGSGYKVTGPNGNNIFLPAAGYRNCYGSVYYVGSSGYYWSSTPKGSGYAWYLSFHYGSVGMYDNDRCLGLSVRLVQD